VGAGGVYGVEPEYRFVCSSWHAGELEDVVVLGDFVVGRGGVGGCCDSVDEAGEGRKMIGDIYNNLVLKFKSISIPNPIRYFLGYIGLILIFSVVYWQFSSFLDISVGSFVEGLYFSVVTMTTLGFGDISPKSDIGRIVVSLQALSGVTLLGFFLNALSHARALEITANENRIAESRKEELRKSLECHACLILDVFKSGNPFAWDKHSKNSVPMNDLETFCRETYFYAFSKKSKINTLQMKMLLEVCNQNYDTLLALTPVAAEISSVHLLEWSSLLSNVRNISQEYQRIIADKNDQDLPVWPACSDMAIQIQELINVSLFLCDRDVMKDHFKESEN
jgi:hypothetical protein